MKRILITSTDLMMIQFLVPHVIYLQENGYDVEIACSDVGSRIDEIKEKLPNTVLHQVRLVRSPISFHNFDGLRDLKCTINQGKYDLIWTNEPVMGIMTRIAAKSGRKNGTKVMYMTHGYHFYNGCPLRLKVFYPIEKYASNLCDAIVTINYEDYQTTSKKFHAKQVYHIDGIGFDTVKYSKKVDVSAKKSELGIPSNHFVILSVGELKPHKNHQIVIKAISALKNKKIMYLICGKGELLKDLIRLSVKMDIAKQVRFLGYRKDVPEIMHCSDIFAFPSSREGLGLASLEAMAAGLPVVGSNTRGIRDYVVDDVTGFLCNPNSADDFAIAIKKLMSRSKRNEISKKCRLSISKYDICNINTTISKIIEDVLNSK